MNAVAIQAFLAVLVQVVGQLLPQLAGDKVTSLVTNIIDILSNLLPDIIKAGQELATTTKNIIAALKGVDGVSADQWAALDAFEKQIDAEFDQAAKDEGF